MLGCGRQLGDRQSPLAQQLLGGLRGIGVDQALRLAPFRIHSHVAI